MWVRKVPAMAERPTILILSGTQEARQLAATLAAEYGEGIRLINSLAGKTKSPRPLPGETRSGGYGGVNGLAGYLQNEGVDLLVDATHPFAAGISINAARAAAITSTPHLVLQRKAWEKQDGDVWHLADSLEEASETIRDLGKRVLLTVGSNDLASFLTVRDLRLFARMIEMPPPELRPRNCEILLERGPFDLAHEESLLKKLEIDLLFTKNSGGNQTGQKLQAARNLNVPVLMIQRPQPPKGEIVVTAAEALVWVRHRLELY